MVHREDLHGTHMLEREAEIPRRAAKERREKAIAFGLESATSITDRSLPLFNRFGVGGKFGTGGTFLSVPFQENMQDLGSPDVAFVGAPLDAGATYRSGTRWGPKAMRDATGLSQGYNHELGVDLFESLSMVDCGDITVIPGNLEKSFDQIDRATAYIHERAIFPVVLGGDHAIGYPDVRGMSPYVDGNIGIIHFDRHPDLSELNLDERMHGTPFLHATNIPNVPAENLVQIGIGGWNTSRPGIANARARGVTSITISDIDRWGLERVAEMALEIAWRNAKVIWLSFDIDVMDPAFAPGTGTPEAGGLLPREALRMLQIIAREGLVGMEVVEVSPPYDVSDITSMLGVRVVCDVLGTLINEGKLGVKPDRSLKSQPEPGQLQTVAKETTS